jgi:hypothetical protein
MDCSNTSAAERACDCDEGVQCPNERNPIFFMGATYRDPCWFATVDVPFATMKDLCKTVA